MRQFQLYILMSLALAVAMPAQAQDSAFDQYRKQKQAQFDKYHQKKQADFENYRETKRKQFEEYRKRKNAAFAEYLGQRWEQMPVQDATPAPFQKPQPQEQPVAPKKDPAQAPLEVTPQEVVTPKAPEVVKPIEVPEPEERETVRRQDVNFFGNRCQIAMDTKLRISLKNIQEAEVARVWQRLSADDYMPMFDDFARLNIEMNLNGWATFQLAKAIGEQLQGKGTNEAAVVATYLMTQLGYDMRLMRVGNRLIPMSPATADVCRYLHLDMDGKTFYIWEELPTNISVECYKQNVAEATRPIDFTDAQAMKLQGGRSETKHFASLINSNAAAEVSVRKSLMEYYNTVPLIADWAVYAAQPMEREVSRQLKPQLEAAIQGLGQWEATRVLLQFVQTAFKYGHDEDLFGRERPLFKEEPFFYPVCDCEDRAILFSDLVHTLVGLDVVLLHYPNHLCTAVRFTEAAKGDYVKVDGQIYYICDPTYTNADCGTCMKEYVGVNPKVHKIVYD